MRPLKIITFIFLFSYCSVIQTYEYEIKLENENKKNDGILVINKIDRLKNRNGILPIMNDLNSKHNFEAIIPISALRKDNLEDLLSKVLEKIPSGEFHYPTIKEKEFSQSFYISEIIREKAINRLGDELSLIHI